MSLSKHLVAAAVGLALTQTPALAVTFPGPNANGYTATTTAFAWQDMTGSTPLVSGDDNYAFTSLPFSFALAGTAYSSMWVSTNGVFGFNAGNAGSHCCNGSASLEASVAPGMMDWVTTVSTLTSGVAGSRTFTIEWQGGEYGYGSPVDMEAILHEGSNNIEFEYRTLTDNGHTMYVGLGGADALGYFTGSTSMSNQAMLISASSVPEPASPAMLLAGLGALGFVARRRAR